MGLTANGQELPPVELRPGRARYPVSLPVVRGENRIDFRFRYAGDPARSSSEKRRLAAAFHRFEVPYEDGGARIGAFASIPERPSALLVPSQGSLSFYLEVPPGSSLRLSVGAKDPLYLRASPGADVTVTLTSEERELWKETFVVSRASQGREEWTRDLPDSEGAPVALSFRAGKQDLVLQPELLAPPPKKDSPIRQGKPPGSRPNIVVIVLDGAGAKHLGLYGGTGQTPHVDALGSESVVFTAALTQAVYTIASVGSLLTGQYPDRHQSVSFADRLREDVVTLPSILSRAGYRTAAFPGNAVVSKTFGLDRGYQEVHPVWEEEGYSGHGDSVVRAFRRWLEDRPEPPFFAYVHLREPHFPYNPPPPYDSGFGPGIEDPSFVEALNREAAPSKGTLARVRGLYLGSLAYADSLVGEILGDLSKETVVILTADHGEALFEHGFVGHNTQLYEESIRVPLMIRAPGFAPRRVSDLVELIDLTPTIAELAGVSDASALARFQGHSLLPALREGSRDGSELAFSRTLWAKPRYSVRSERYKLIWDSRTGASELYDLERDSAERTTLGSPVLEGYLTQQLFLWYLEQERLKATEPRPDDALLSEEERRELESLSYLDHLPRKKDEPK
jgi:arylsulfatase A-like enzyme